jgi:hypothetical protein
VFKAEVGAVMLKNLDRIVKEYAYITYNNIPKNVYVAFVWRVYKRYGAETDGHSSVTTGHAGVGDDIA